MPLMVTCQNCGHPFQTTITQVSREDFHLRKFPSIIAESKKFSEKCPHCNKDFDYYFDNFYWKEMWEI
jgi:hypothetical protein